MSSVARSDTRRDRIRATREKKAKLARAAAAWAAAREGRSQEEELAGGSIFSTTAGPVTILACPISQHGIELWIVMAVAGGKVVEYTTRMSEWSILREADLLSRKYSSNGELPAVEYLHE